MIEMTTAMDFVELLLGDGSEAVAVVESAAAGGWLVTSDVAYVETDDGRRFLVTVQEVTDR